ncbi:nucleoside-diphosphate-sugar epimerase [Rhizodiscina lignyota]|uniref:Nucleoside-diphosphate-sugar epimerase n=1 Tax=Rhizodiscina lignyota TaxID=1504668 RepID=A0A9P4M8U7_9PEZI|nr:nucleoside-diphosphate-sugar epimerase [Rhizodiscina lignyota]
MEEAGSAQPRSRRDSLSENKQDRSIVKLRYFITGTAGFIGFHLARRLLEEGHDVVGFDGMTPYYNVKLKEMRHAVLSGYPRFQSIIALLENREKLETAMREAKPDIVVHLAAQAGVRFSLENPRSYLSSNVEGSWNVLDIAKELDVRHLLLASTSSIYGANESVPFRETDCADQPLTIYAATKKSVELMAHSYAHLYGVPTTSFRFFTVYGPWGRPDMALFKFVESMLSGRAIDIYGEGKMSRDFTYIDDLIEGIVRLVGVPPGAEDCIVNGGFDTLSRQAPFRIVNIGGGQPINLMSFVEMVEDALGQRAVRNMLPMQQGDVPRTHASSDLLVALTGFKPRTPLREGVQAFVDWYIENREAMME